MKVMVYSNNLNIGTGILGNHLSGMGGMHGSFTPNETYHLVQRKFGNCSLRKEMIFTKMAGAQIYGAA